MHPGGQAVVAEIFLIGILGIAAVAETLGLRAEMNRTRALSTEVRAAEASLQTARNTARKYTVHETSLLKALGQPLRRPAVAKSPLLSQTALVPPPPPPTSPTEWPPQVWVSELAVQLYSGAKPLSPGQARELENLMERHASSHGIDWDGLFNETPGVLSPEQTAAFRAVRSREELEWALAQRLANALSRNP